MEPFQAVDAWRVDDGLISAVKGGVLQEAKDNEWGPRKIGEKLAFRASELGDLVAFRDHKGEPGGCQRKVFYSFHADKYPAADFTAEELLNFDKGNEAEDRIEVYLRKAGLYVEGQVKLGAWPSGGPNAGDPRYPDRSGGLVRGTADFVVKHPEHGVIPLEWKSCSTYVFDMVSQHGPKPENALQAIFYAHEMGATHAALGYTNKETGDVLIFTTPAQPALMEVVFAKARLLRAAVLAGEVPAMPEGARGAQEGEHRSGATKLPEHPFYDRAWPCYAYMAKKGRAMACRFYAHCHGAVPEKPADAHRKAKPKKDKARPNPLLKTESFNFDK